MNKIVADEGERIFHIEVRRQEYIMVVGEKAKVYERNQFTRTVMVGSAEISIDIDRYTLMGEYYNYRDAETAIRRLNYVSGGMAWAELPKSAIVELEKNCRREKNDLAVFVADAANRWGLVDFFEKPFTFDEEM